MRYLALLALSLVACGGGRASTAAVPAANVAHGPVSIPFDPAGDGDPSSVAWDEASSTLYVADNQHDRLWSWTDADGFRELAKLPADPAAPGRNSVGQIVHLPDGTFVVPRFGFGDHGGIVFTSVAGKSGSIPGLAADRRRIGLACTPDGQMFGAYFDHPKGESPIGTVTKVTLTGETPYATGFKKPVAVLAHDGKLIVSDQAADTLYALPLDGAKAPYPVFAKVPNPDALAEGPDGSIVTGQFRQTRDGEAVHLRQVFPDGRVVAVSTPFELTKPQGVAYDRKNHRLFVADSNARDVRTVKIIPL